MGCPPLRAKLANKKPFSYTDGLRFVDLEDFDPPRWGLKGPSMKRLFLGVLVLLGVGWFAWRQQDHNPGIRTKEQNNLADVERTKKMALAGDGDAATRVAIWHHKRGELEEGDRWLAHAVKAKEPKGMGLYGAGLVTGRIAPKAPGTQILEAIELFQWAANHRDPYSIFVLGAFAYEGQVPIVQDREKGLKYIEDAAKLGDPTAWRWLEDHPDP